MLYDFFIIKTSIPISASHNDNEVSPEGLTLFRILDVITRFSHPMMVTVKHYNNEYQLKFSLERGVDKDDLIEGLNGTPVPVYSPEYEYFKHNENFTITKIVIE